MGVQNYKKRWQDIREEEDLQSLKLKADALFQEIFSNIEEEKESKEESIELEVQTTQLVVEGAVSTVENENIEDKTDAEASQLDINIDINETEVGEINEEKSENISSETVESQPEESQQLSDCEEEEELAEEIDEPDIPFEEDLDSTLESEKEDISKIEISSIGFNNPYNISRVDGEFKKDFDATPCSQEFPNAQYLLRIQIKRGIVGEEYKYEFDRPDIVLGMTTYSQFENVDFLEWDPDNLTFSGTPTKAGEFKGCLKFYNSKPAQELDCPKIVVEVHIGVNQNPKDLWKNIPPSKQAIFYKDNEYTSFVKLNQYNIASASVRGISHAHKGAFRDDDFIQFVSSDEKWILQAVSDGAGSAKYSREGSRRICGYLKEKIEQILLDEQDELNELLNVIRENYSSNEKDEAREQNISSKVYKLMAGTAFHAQQKLQEFIRENNMVVRDFYATLLFTLTYIGEQDSVILFFAVGDGAIGVLSPNNNSLLNKPDSGKYAGQTHFINNPDIFKDITSLAQRCGVKYCPNGFDALMLMTDGVSDPIFGSENSLKEDANWLGLWDNIKEKIVDMEKPDEELLKWLNFYKKGEFDDRTLSLIYRYNESC